MEFIQGIEGERYIERTFTHRDEDSQNTLLMSLQGNGPGGKITKVSRSACSKRSRQTLSKILTKRTWLHSYQRAYNTKKGKRYWK